MNVSDIMTRNPATIQATGTLRQALETMEQIGCHHLPVLSSENHVIGVITARDCRLALKLPDIVRKFWQEDKQSLQLPVRSVMTPGPIVTTPDTPAAEAVRLMLGEYVSCLPVMQDETLVGIVTVSDILVAFAKMQNNL